MRFPPKSYNKDLESAEDRREREAQVIQKDIPLFYPRLIISFNPQLILVSFQSKILFDFI